MKSKTEKPKCIICEKNIPAFCEVCVLEKQMEIRNQERAKAKKFLEQFKAEIRYVELYNSKGDLVTMKLIKRLEESFKEENE